MFTSRRVGGYGTGALESAGGDLEFVSDFMLVCPTQAFPAKPIS
jgi:hypothetical protein